MRVLVVGAGVVGTVYGAHLAAAGNTVWVLSHGPRTGEVAAGGLCARDVLGGGRADAETAVVPDARPRTARPSPSCAGPSPGLSPPCAPAGLPRNLAVLHSPLLRPVAVRYWARTMRSPMGELCFAAHCRHAEAEMRDLGQDAAARITGSPAVAELLGP